MRKEEKEKVSYFISEITKTVTIVVIILPTSQTPVETF